MDTLFNIGIEICTMYIIYKIFFRIRYKEKFNRFDIVLLLLSFLFIVALVVADLISNMTYGYISVLKYLLIGIFSLIITILMIQIVLKVYYYFRH